MLEHACSYLSAVETGNINIALEAGFIVHTQVCLYQVQYLRQGVGSSRLAACLFWEWCFNYIVVPSQDLLVTVAASSLLWYTGNNLTCVLGKKCLTVIDRAGRSYFTGMISKLCSAPHSKWLTCSVCFTWSGCFGDFFWSRYPWTVPAEPSCGHGVGRKQCPPCDLLEMKQGGMPHRGTMLVDAQQWDGLGHEVGPAHLSGWISTSCTLELVLAFRKPPSSSEGCQLCFE